MSFLVAADIDIPDPPQKIESNAISASLTASRLVEMIDNLVSSVNRSKHERYFRVTMRRLK